MPAGPARRLLSFFALAMACVMLGGCATTGSGGEDGNADRTLTIATSYTIDDLDPVSSGYWGVEFGYVELLMRPQADGEPTPWALSDLQQVDDTTWRLTLNEGIRFRSGRALDGAALAQLLTFAAENTADFGTSSGFATAEATGPLEVALTTTAPSPTMPQLLADEANVPIFDVDAYQRWKDSGAPASALLDAGLYTGPYAVSGLDSQAMTLQPVQDHWSGQPALDGVTLRFVPEATARVQAVQAGEADLALYMASGVARTLEGRQDAYFLSGGATGFQWGLVSRVASPVMQDERVRRAIYAGIDYRAMAEDVLDGLTPPATSVFPPDYPYAVDSQVTDAALATRLLDEAGWLPGPDGIRLRDGRPLTVRIIAGTALPDYVVIAEAMQAQLRPIGIDMQVVTVDDLQAARDGADWEVSLSSSLTSFGGSPDQAITELLTTDGSLNYAGISDAQLDAATAALRSTSDDARRNELLGEIQRILHDRGYYAVAAPRAATVVAGPNWRDYPVPVSNLWVDRTTVPSP